MRSIFLTDSGDGRVRGIQGNFIFPAQVIYEVADRSKVTSSEGQLRGGQHGLHARIQKTGFSTDCTRQEYKIY
jgi:hypothetical protein